MISKINKKATSIAEAMIVMLVVVTGVTGMYNIYSKSIQLSNSTTNKIKAIQIATQGIEAMTNIRDTNWLLFSSDYKNCWNTLNYNPDCIGNPGPDYRINSDHYRIYRDSNNRWMLEKEPSTMSNTMNFFDTDVNDFYRVGLDSFGLYTQTGTITSRSNLKPSFQRKLTFQYLDDDGITIVPTRLANKMLITSTVQWLDNTSRKVHKIDIEQVLSNWKK